ncbi:alpha/beta fold hydrolase [Kytococcus sedentarius]|uniref:alpha/beta fold hydrolase n=1 Tax=Kytococcus sedentarius TaxID=1276 RepID=UPI0035BBEC92
MVFDVRDGGPQGGEVVVLLHGFPQDASSWQDVEPLLHGAGLRTLAPDQRGYSPGASPTATGAYRLEELVGDVVAVIDAAGADRVHLVGHDWGGAAAWAVATRHPARVASLTVLSTPHPAAFARALRTLGQLRKSWYMGAFQVPRLPELLLAGRVGALLRRQGVPAAERYGRRFATADSLRGPIGWYRANAGLGGAIFRDPVVVPTTYVWGSRDAALGRTGAELTAHHVEGDYRFVELDADHWLPEKEAQRVADEVIRRAR